MTKKDKKLHRLKNDDIEVDMEVEVEESSSKKKHKRKLQQDAPSAETTETCHEQTVITEPSPKKKSKKKSKNKCDQKIVTIETVESQLSPKKKKKEKKKEKKKKSAEESLGIVDTDILRQAKVNLGLHLVDDPVSSQKENVEEEQSSKQKKKKKDKKSQVVSSSEPNEKNRNERATEYLRLWHADKKVWKFNKMMQVQLLHIMYDKSLMNDEDFEVLLLYLDGLKGKGRERTMEDAKKVLDKEETADTVDADKEDRARQIFQMLA